MTEDPNVAMRQLRIITIEPGVKVDQDEKSADCAITIHEGVLRQHSPFFQAMLDKHWKEAGTGVVKMPEDRSDVLIAYINWLYTNVIPPLAIGRWNDYSRLTRLYVLGEKIQDHAFCDQIITAITKGIDSSKHHPGALSVEIIYSGTSSGSPIRQLLLKSYSAYGSESWFTAEKGPYNAEFMNDLVKQFIRNRGTGKAQCWYDQRAKWFKQK